MERTIKKIFVFIVILFCLSFMTMNIYADDYIYYEPYTKVDEPLSDSEIMSQLRITNFEGYSVDQSQVDYSKEGKYPVYVYTNEKTITVYLNVSQTKPVIASTQDLYITTEDLLEFEVGQYKNGTTIATCIYDESKIKDDVLLHSDINKIVDSDTGLYVVTSACESENKYASDITFVYINDEYSHLQTQNSTYLYARDFAYTSDMDDSDVKKNSKLTVFDLSGNNKNDLYDRFTYDEVANIITIYLKDGQEIELENIANKIDGPKFIEKEVDEEFEVTDYFKIGSEYGYLQLNNYDINNDGVYYLTVSASEQDVESSSFTLLNNDGSYFINEENNKILHREDNFINENEIKKTNNNLLTTNTIYEKSQFDANYKFELDNYKVNNIETIKLKYEDNGKVETENSFTADSVSKDTNTEYFIYVVVFSVMSLIILKMGVF